MPRNKAIGIVGGAGYLGRDLARALCAENQVRIIDVKPPDDLDANARLTFLPCDITRAPDCDRALRGLDIVFHKAGLYGNLASMKSPESYYRINVTGTLNVLQACVANAVSRLVFDSTEFVYGRGVVSPVTEEAVARPASIYGATKLVGEEAVRMYDAVHGLSTIVLRYCRVRDRTKEDVISALAGRILKGETITLFDAGAPCMDYVDVADVTRACMLAADSPVRGEIINIGPGEGMSLNQIVETIRDALAVPKVETLYRNASAGSPTAEYQFGPETFYMSVAKADSLMGWKPETTIRRSIRDTVELLASGVRA